MAKIIKIWNGTEFVEVDARNSDMLDGKHASEFTLVTTTDAHINNTNVHVTSADKTKWNAKSDLALGETSTTAYSGDRGKIAYDHSQITHAPADAQKNSDITKAEIEAKLTGTITSHTHDTLLPGEATTSTNGLMSATDKAKLDGIETGAQVNAVTSVAGKTGAVKLDKSDVGLGVVNNYGLATKEQAQAGELNTVYMTPLRTAEAISALTALNIDLSIADHAALSTHITDEERIAWNAKSDLALGTSSTTAYRGDYGNVAYNHSQSDHAPVDAQKNSDITKAEIEAKLTGTITSHVHDSSSISGLGTAATKNTGIASGNIPVLGSDGKLDSTILPAIAITDTFVVSNESEMLALTVQVGDVAVRSDLSKSFILKESPATVLENWQELLTPTDTVISINGKAGAVTLTASDVGLENVTNESKSTMFASPSLTGIPTAPTADISTNTTQIATTAFVKSQGYLTTNKAITVSGDVTGSGTTALSLTLADSGVTAGTYKSVTVDAKGRITAGTNPTTLEGYGITDAVSLSHIGSTGSAHGLATTSVNGFMSATDKTKLDSISSGANKVSISTTAPTNAAIGDLWVSEVTFS